MVVKRTRLFKSAGTFQRHVKLLRTNELLEGSRIQWAAPVLNPVLNAAVRLNGMRYMSGVPESGILNAHNTDYELPYEVWNSYASKMITTSMGYRSNLYLTWRYGMADEGFRAFQLWHNAEQAWLVWKVIKNRAYVVDMLYPMNNHDMGARLLAHFEDHCLNLKLSMVVLQYLGCDELIQHVEKKLFYRRYHPTNKELLIASNDDILLTHLTEGSKYWFACDEDAIE